MQLFHVSGVSIRYPKILAYASQLLQNCISQPN